MYSFSAFSTCRPISPCFWPSTSSTHSVNCDHVSSSSRTVCGDLSLTPRHLPPSRCVHFDYIHHTFHVCMYVCNCSVYIQNNNTATTAATARQGGSEAGRLGGCTAAFVFRSPRGTHTVPRRSTHTHTTDVYTL